MTNFTRRNITLTSQEVNTSEESGLLHQQHLTMALDEGFARGIPMSDSKNRQSGRSGAGDDEGRRPDTSAGNEPPNAG